MVKNRCLLLTEEEFSMQLPLLKLGTFWFASFLSLEFIFNIHSNKTSLAIAYSVFQELSTAHRDNRPIQEFYTIMRTIDWHRLSPMEEELCSTYSACGCAKKLQRARDQQRLFQFLMRLRLEFESIRGQLPHKSPLPTLDVALSEFIAEEIRLQVLGSSRSAEPATALAASGSRSSTSSFLLFFKIFYARLYQHGKPGFPPFEVHLSDQLPESDERGWKAQLIHSWPIFLFCLIDLSFVFIRKIKVIQRRVLSCNA